jgi:hypothetical protein
MDQTIIVMIFHNNLITTENNELFNNKQGIQIFIFYMFPLCPQWFQIMKKL